MNDLSNIRIESIPSLATCCRRGRCSDRSLVCATLLVRLSLVYSNRLHPVCARVYSRMAFIGSPLGEAGLAAHRLRTERARSLSRIGVAWLAVLFLATETLMTPRPNRYEVSTRRSGIGL